MVRSRAVIEPVTRPARRAVSAVTPPLIVLPSPWTRAEQAMSPSTLPST
jgi:hypothetical protein